MISTKLREYTKNGNWKVTVATGDHNEERITENVIYRGNFQESPLLTGDIEYSEQNKSFNK